MRRALLFALLGLLCFRLSASDRWFKLGVGNYEGLHLGQRHNFSRWSLEYGLGTDLNVFDQGLYAALHLAAGKAFLRRFHSEKTRSFLQFKTLVWNIENRSNIFSAVSLNPEILIERELSPRYRLAVHGGLVWSSVFRYHRKNFNDVGFPKEWQPGIGLSVYCRL